ncbi:unnamed protein product [Phytophthora lilii]|uniref:Unnamed protein product n=1 Tax=Phytophthora lilii TaxID=2077276 RepID=A0A9W6WVS0_9STRA|nr:unnamed protein product [Phytophthora lilii]
MTTSTGYLTYGLERTDDFCGVAIGAEGFPFLVLFHQMEPDAPQGSIHVEQETDQQGQHSWRLDHMDLPSDITRYRVLLFSSTVSTGGGECKAIDALCSLGVQEDRITLVVILCSTDSLVVICNRFPDELDETLFSADAYTVASTLQSQNAGTAILQQALDEQRKVFGTSSTATSLAVRVASILDPVRFCGDEELPLRELITTRVVLGGATSDCNSRVFGGILLPIEDGLSRDILRRRFNFSGGTIAIDGGIALIDGDVETVDFALDYSVQVIFAHGEVSAQVLDASASTPNAGICIPVSSYDFLHKLAEMSGAEIVDSCEEILPSTIGHECLLMQLHNLAVHKVSDDEGGDETVSFFLQIKLPDASHQPHASIVVQGPTRSLAVEVRNDTSKMVWRLRNALRSGYLLPGNGSLWCASAAAVALAAETLNESSRELLNFATAYLAYPLVQLGVILLENSGGWKPNSADNSFFSRLSKVRNVQNRFARGVHDVGASKFFSRYYDFRAAEYAVIPLRLTEPESEDGRLFHADDRCQAAKTGEQLQQLLAKKASVDDAFTALKLDGDVNKILTHTNWKSWNTYIGMLGKQNDEANVAVISTLTKTYEDEAVAKCFMTQR